MLLVQALFLVHVHQISTVFLSHTFDPSSVLLVDAVLKITVIYAHLHHISPQFYK